MIPTLVLDGKVIYFHHLGQLASALGLPMSADQKSFLAGEGIVLPNAFSVDALPDLGPPEAAY